MTTSDGNTPQEKIAKIIEKAAPATKKPRKTTKKQELTPQANNITVTGSGNVVAAGDVTQHIINTVHNHAPAPARPKVVVKTGDGTITAEQKAEIKRLVDEWIAVNNAVKVRQLTFPAAWGKFNAAMKVNAYAEIKEERFDPAIAWLRKRIAMLRGTRSAPRKVPDYRTKRVAAIKARCKNQLGDESAYATYIKRNFNAHSLTELGDADLERTYRYVMGKKVRPAIGTAQA